MRTFDELESQWLAGPAPAQGRGGLHLIVVRTGNGEHATPERSRLDVEQGLEGDRWIKGRDGMPGDPLAQITLMNRRVCELLGAPLDLAGDNLLVDIDLSVRALPAGARVRVGGALLEITEKAHLGCKKFAERFGQDALRWVNWAAHRERRLRGVNCRIVESGPVAVGDPVEVLARSIPA